MALTDNEKIRLMIGDTDSSDYLIDDDELDYITSVESNVVHAAIDCCRIIIAKMARYVDSKRGRTWERASQITEHYKGIMVTLTQRATVSTNSLYAGGIRISDKDGYEADTDRVKPSFKKGMHDDITPSLEKVDRDE